MRWGGLVNLNQFNQCAHPERGEHIDWKIQVRCCLAYFVGLSNKHSGSHKQGAAPQVLEASATAIIHHMFCHRAHESAKATLSHTHAAALSHTHTTALPHHAAAATTK